MLAVTFLQSVTQHRSIDFFEQILPNLDGEVVRPYSQDLLVERGVMDLAQREAIGHGRNASFLRVRHDVRGVEEFGVPKGADSAAGLVRAHHHPPEDWLMKPLLDLAGHISA